MACPSALMRMLAGFQIAVDDAHLVGRLECLGNLRRNFDGVGFGHRTTRDEIGQVLAADELHRDEPLTVGLVETEDSRDVGVVDRRQRLGLAFKSAHALGVGRERLGQDLDRDFTVEGAVDRLPDHPHAARADLVDETVVQQGLARFEGAFFFAPAVSAPRRH